MHGSARQGEQAGARDIGISPVAIDANALDRSGGARGALVDRFLGLVGSGAVTLVVAGGVREEVLRPETPADIRQTVLSCPPPPRRSPTHERTLNRIRVRAILRGDAAAGRHEADALHLSETAEAGCAIFLTHDRRILRRRADLRSVMPGLRIMTLERFMAWIDRADDGFEGPAEDEP